MASKITPPYSTLYLTECLLTFVSVEYFKPPAQRSLSKQDLLWQVRIAQDGLRFIKKLGVDLVEESRKFDSSLKTQWVVDYGEGDVKTWLRRSFAGQVPPIPYKPLF